MVMSDLQRLYTMSIDAASSPIASRLSVHARELMD